MSYSGISDHHRYKKKLVAPINRLPISQIIWDRDMLPEYLWIEYLRQSYNEVVFLDMHLQFVKIFDSYIEEPFTFLGLISDFSKIPDGCKEEIKQKHSEIIEKAFLEPFGDVLNLYPDSPASWLLSKKWENDNEYNEKVTIPILKNTIEKILPGKDPYTSYLRMIPLRVLMEKGKIHVPKGLEIIELLPKYPHHLSTDEREMCESFGRSVVNIATQDNFSDLSWSKYFWRRNFDLSACENFHNQNRYVLKPIDENKFNKIQKICSINGKILKDYLKIVIKNYTIDLYSPDKDEIILGLFSRIIRIGSLILNNPLLWSYDLSRIMIRCLSDSTITYCYLILKNDDELFNSFIEHGKGKEKLLLLHLQDNHPDAKTVSGESVDQLVNSMGGGFSPELIDINLGDWKKISARKMAQECGLTEVYRVIYDPSSSDIHGTWTSIKNANLTHCINPLHRYHRIPQQENPPIFLEPVRIALDLIVKTIDLSIENIGFPIMSKSFQNLPEINNI